MGSRSQLQLVRPSPAPSRVREGAGLVSPQSDTLLLLAPYGEGSLPREGLCPIPLFLVCPPPQMVTTLRCPQGHPREVRVELLSPGDPKPLQGQQSFTPSPCAGTPGDNTSSSLRHWGLGWPLPVPLAGEEAGASRRSVPAFPGLPPAKKFAPGSSRSQALRGQHLPAPLTPAPLPPELPRPGDGGFVGTPAPRFRGVPDVRGAIPGGWL